MDEFDERLWSAAPTVADDTEVRRVLNQATARPRRWQLPVALGLAAGLLALGGVAAAAAAVFGPWSLQNPTVSFSRDWTDLDGNYLGTCETRLRLGRLPAEVRPVVEEYLATHDIDSLEPSWGTVAGLLVATGRPERFPELRVGGDVTDYRITIDGEVWGADEWSDARILQAGLERTVTLAINRELVRRMSELGNIGITGTSESQCSTDPDWMVEQRGTWPNEPSA